MKSYFNSLFLFSKTRRRRKALAFNGVSLRWLLWLTLCAALPAAGAGAEAPPSSGGAPSLFEMSLESLLELSIVSASKKETEVFDTPAAAFVITAEDIRRSGAASLPEALRTVPGVEVARMSSNTWSVSIRGFSGEFANKLLVLIDGRSVYTPFSAGVFWDMQNVMLEDVERIEVIRGPGGTLWGSNAVNGVINVITKEANNTQGVLATAGAGTFEKGFGAIRYGGRIGEAGHFRVYARYFNRDDTPSDTATDGADDWDMFQTGFRADWRPDALSRLTVQGDLFNGRIGNASISHSFESPRTRFEREHFTARGGNVLARWEHTVSETAQGIVQAYYDQYERTDYAISEIRRTFDADAQYRFALGGRHDLVTGLGYRFTTDRTDGTFMYSLQPDSRDLRLYSVFAQDEITLIENRLNLTLGLKLEHNTFTGMEYQPNVRVAWTPSERHTLWAAVSRAVRIPSRNDEDSVLHAMVRPFVLSIRGDEDISAEKVIAYELGYRVRPVRRLQVDCTLFYNRYDDIRAGESKGFVLMGRPFPHLEMPIVFDNCLYGETYGAELAATWQVLETWRLFFGTSFLEVHMHVPRNSRASDDLLEGRSPENHLYLRSSLDISRTLELDALITYVDHLSGQGVHSYTRLDVRLGWHLNDRLELSLVGRNLLDRRHVEYLSDEHGGRSNEVERSGYAKLTWRF